MLLEDLPKLVVDDSFYKQITNGVKIKVLHKDEEKVSVVCKNRLIGIGSVENNLVSIKTNLLGDV